MSYIWGVQITCQVARSHSPQPSSASRWARDQPEISMSFSSQHAPAQQHAVKHPAARTVIVTGQTRSPEISRCSIARRKYGSPLSYALM